MSEQADWLRAYALMGTYLGDQVQIALGPGGLFYAVLRGQGPTGLQTVKVDEDGRLSAFVIDSSDAWGQLLQVGNAELAARLGSMVQLDRRGQVILATDFSQGWDVWTALKVGTDDDSTLDPTMYRTGGYSVKIPGGADAGDHTRFYTYLPSLPINTAGLAIYFCVPTGIERVDLRMIYDDGTTSHLGHCRLHFDAGTLDVLNGDSGYVEVLDSIALAETSRAFHYLKLVIDGDNDSFVRVLLNQEEVDLSAYSLYTAASAGYPTLHMGIWPYTATAVEDILYLDSVVVTIKEPT